MFIDARALVHASQLKRNIHADEDYAGYGCGVGGTDP